MSPEEIITAIEAAEALMPAIEKAFKDVQIVINDVQTTIAALKVKMSGAKAAVASLPPTA